MDVILVFLVSLILVCFGLVKLAVDNIVIILLIIAIAIVFLVSLLKKPIKTLSVVLVLGVIVLCVSCVAMSSRENNIPVTISKATKTCQVYDQDKNLIKIPAGAIVARYRDEDERVSEQAYGGLYVGFLSTCYWYYNGSTYSFIESVVSDRNEWNLEEITEITYKEFQKGDWININTNS